MEDNNYTLDFEASRFARDKSTFIRDATLPIQNFLKFHIFSIRLPNYYTENGDKFSEIHSNFLNSGNFLKSGIASL